MVFWLRRVVSGLILAAAGHGAHAQVYPVQPITIVVPFAPRGAGDTISRLLAERLSGPLHQLVNVENRPGGGGARATEQVSKATPDGYTVLYVTGSTMLVPLFDRTPGYDPLRSLEPISFVSWAPGLIAVNRRISARDLPELTALVRANPGRYRHATYGPGSLSFLAGELFKTQTSSDIRDATVKGVGAVVQSVVKGDADMIFDTAIPIIPKVLSGELRALAVMGHGRIAELPDVPTVSEAGMPEFTAYMWSGIAAPFGTPPEIVDVLNRSVREVLDEIETKNAFRKYGQYAESSTPEGFRRFIQAELSKWARAVPLSATAPQ